MPPRGIKNGLTVTRDEFTAMWTSSLSTSEIAARCGRSESNVVRWAARFGLPPRSAGRRSFVAFMTATQEEFVRVWKSGATLEEIAQQCGMTRHNVSRYAKHLGLRRQIPSEERVEHIRDEFAAMWNNPHVTRAEISRHFKIHKNTASTYASTLGLPPKAMPEDDCEGPMPGDPTPEEIEELKAYANARRIIAKRFNFEEQDTVA